MRPLGVWVMTLLAARHSAAGTFHSLAAACTSSVRASAPPLRTYSCDSRMPRLPPVEKLPQARLRARFWPGVGYSVRTRAQSQSSSSATSCARPVSVPWPISERAMRTITVSSLCTTTQALISGVAAPAWAFASPASGMWKATTSAPAVELPMNWRRVRPAGVTGATGSGAEPPAACGSGSSWSKAKISGVFMRRSRRCARCRARRPWGRRPAPPP